jgi:hypothetical protein
MGMGKMEDIKKEIKLDKILEINEENLGLILSKLESIEDFFQCYKSMMKKE